MANISDHAYTCSNGYSINTHKMLARHLPVLLYHFASQQQRVDFTSPPEGLAENAYTMQ